MSLHAVSPLSCNFCPARPIEFEVSGAPLSSDAGLLLIRQFDQKILHQLNTRSRNLEEIDMGAIANAIVAFAQPLLDQTDGSLEQVNKAFVMSQLCWNLALAAEDTREQRLSDLQPQLRMSDEEFSEFRHSVFLLMIQRHKEMFPHMHRRDSSTPYRRDSLPPTPSRTAAPVEKPTVIDRYAPCPCKSGEKYKFCCGKKSR